MPTSTAADIIIASAKYLTATLRQINRNPLLPLSDTITRKAHFQLYYIFSNDSYSLKTQQPTTFKLPRVFTSKPIDSPPRASLSTTQDFHNISPITQKHFRDLRAAKSKASPKASPFSSLSHKFRSNPHPNTTSLDNNNSAFTNINLPVKLQDIV